MNTLEKRAIRHLLTDFGYYLKLAVYGVMCLTNRCLSKTILVHSFPEKAIEPFIKELLLFLTFIENFLPMRPL